MKLTEHFSLDELTRSGKALELGIDNTPDPELIPRLMLTAEMLERVRSTLGNNAIVVSSGYRSPALNAAVGGVSTSDHQAGYAVDIVCPGYGTPFEICRTLAPLISVLGIGQLIHEGVKGKRWVHLSTRMPAKTVNRVITISDAGTELGIKAIP